MKKINDFGKKIGGARKDIWAERGLSWNDALDMNISEKQSYVKRDSIWPKPDVIALIDSGTPRFIVYWQNEIRKAIFPKPSLYDDESLKLYIESVQKIKGLALAVTKEDQIDNFYAAVLPEFLVRIKAHTWDYKDERYRKMFHGNVFLRGLSSYEMRRMKQKMKDTGFGMSKEEHLRSLYKVAKIDGTVFALDYSQISSKMRHLVETPGSDENEKISYYGDSLNTAGLGDYVVINSFTHHVEGVFKQEESCVDVIEYLIKEKLNELATQKRSSKKRWIPPQLSHIKREGEDYRNGRAIKGDDFISDFGIRGGEFGNWTNDNDRQMSLNMAYDALMDLSKALKISRLDIALPEGLREGALAIAFGSRGRGNALAHYEVDREVINLTKMKGAGSLAHEWAHALDDAIGKRFGLSDMASEKYRTHQKELPKSFVELMDTMKHGSLGADMRQKTQYYKNSNFFNTVCSKAGHGYWTSNCELFARAFACYVLDRAEGRSDYLNGHAETVSITTEDGEIVVAFPQGEERKLFNQLFDQLIEELKSMDFLHQPIDIPKKKISSVLFEVKGIQNPSELSFEEQSNGQLCLF